MPNLAARTRTRRLTYVRHRTFVVYVFSYCSATKSLLRGIQVGFRAFFRVEPTTMWKWFVSDIVIGCDCTFHVEKGVDGELSYCTAYLGIHRPDSDYRRSGWQIALTRNSKENHAVHHAKNREQYLSIGLRCRV